MTMKLESAGAAGRPDTRLQFSWAATPQRARVSSLAQSGRGVRPQSRPIRRIEAPSAALSRSRAPRACVAETAAAAPIRLTERGVALILLTGLLLLVTAATVIGLTAFRVTSPEYRPYAQSQEFGGESLGAAVGRYEVSWPSTGRTAIVLWRG